MHVVTLRFVGGKYDHASAAGCGYGEIGERAGE
jgi:hypothetical protein